MAKKNKENEIPGTGVLNPEKKAKRCRWNAECDALLIGQLLAEKADGNQTDNAGWHQAAWTACARVLEGSEEKRRRCGELKGQYQLVKMLRDKSGWGWDDEEKHIVVENSIWDVYLAINPKIKPWRHKGFPLFDEMADLIDGAVATGEGAFQPGLQAPRALSPAWPEDLPEDDEDDVDFPLDPTLKGAGGRVDPPVHTASLADNSVNSDMDDIEVEPVATQSVPRKRVRAVSDSPPAAKRRRSDGHGRKPSNGHAIMAVSESLQGIAAAFKGESSGPASPKRKTEAIKVIARMVDFTKEEKSRIVQLIRVDTGVADAFMALNEVDPENAIDYLRTEMRG
ncbi:hypothetical protein DFH09DRAFT_1105072 [Mycena vulgaris]|nr:hypothetical protein DFH09DRAFT_1105072 [Mycena vulgaris]